MKEVMATTLQQAHSYGSHPITVNTRLPPVAIGHCSGRREELTQCWPFFGFMITLLLFFLAFVG